ncbi:MULTISPECIES: TetR/AcrR family transcriptional regulator [Actinoalloteichus]|uniref:Transcriptional regulator, TetR family n=1 Tax=Actinoalloteichus fjordicus TaxID=1612552 RepID=A0AAC9LF93_9PSEU|nr:MULTISPECIES: TetR/AcrR family transcriptional regulator [Actinoalloteichus]APU16848.1 transcriptional regulator, TetR family [Actinoalloteichus fjordicus]APU22913.1 transcriptional regulator, TetR family [Actinoalloteichus sp. GBA129-24]
MPRPLIPNRSAVILDTAEDLIRTRGYDRTTVADIAERAGIAKGAVYREYPSKEAVLDALLVRSVGRLVADVRARVEEDAEPMGLAAVYRFGIQALRGEPLVYAFLYGTSDVLGSYARDRTDDRYALRLAWLTEYLAELQRAGAIRADIDSDAVALALSAVTVGFLSVGPLMGGLSEKQLDGALDVITELVERGLDRSEADADRQETQAAQLRLLDRVATQLQAPERGSA